MLVLIIERGGERHTAIRAEDVSWSIFFYDVWVVTFWTWEGYIQVWTEWLGILRNRGHHLDGESVYDVSRLVRERRTATDSNRKEGGDENRFRLVSKGEYGRKKDVILRRLWDSSSRRKKMLTNWYWFLVLWKKMRIHEESVRNESKEESGRVCSSASLSPFEVY